MQRLLTGLVVLFAVATPAWADAPALTGVFPAGGPQGAAFTADITGSNLGGATAILVSGTGVTVEKQGAGDAGNVLVRFTLKPDAELGLHEIRVVTPKGASSAGRIWIDPPGIPEVAEKEPNDTIAQAQLLPTLPVTLNGRIDRAEDLDCYAFDAGTGDTFVFALNAAQHFSAMDGLLSLRDAHGKDLQTKLDNFGRDPVLIYTFRSAGRYILRVRDSMYRGGAGYTYRLTLGKLPYVTAWSPMGGQRGASVPLTLEGVNLGGMVSAAVTLPKDPAKTSVVVALKTANGLTNPLRLFLDDVPDVPEKEPNDTVATAMRLPALPVIVSGRIDRDGDRDVFAFPGKAGQAVLLDVLARRERSRLDSVMRVLDANGKELAQNDDAVGKDSRLTFTPPKDGDYFVEVRSLSGRGGDGFFYRLRLASNPPPTYRLTLSPDSITIPAGAAVAVTVTAVREGYSGEIRLTTAALPTGITASAGTLRAGQNSTTIVLTAAAGAASGGPLRIAGAAQIGGVTQTREAVGEEKYVPPLAQQDQIRFRPVLLPVSAVGPEAPFALTVAPSAAAVKAGGKLELTVKLTRKASFKEDLVVTVPGLPAGVTASALTIEGNQSEGKVTLTIGGGVTPGPAGFVVEAAAKAATLAAPAFEVTVQPGG